MIKNRYFKTAMILIVMIIMATTEGLVNIFGTSIIKEFNVSDTKYSMMFTLGSIAYLIFNYLGGKVCIKVGQKNLFLIGLLGSVFGNLVLSTATSFNIFILGFILMQLCLGMMGLAVNTVIPLIWVTSQALVMNITHFSYGAGLSLTQKVTGVLISNNISWRNLYIWSSIINLVVFSLFIFINFPREKATLQNDKIDLRKFLSDKVSWLFIIGLGGYIASEQSVGRWLPIYLNDKFSNFDTNIISSVVSLFFLALTIGRLVGGFIVEKIGALKSVIAFSLIGSVLFITGLSLNEKGLYLVSISGFFFSIIFPTTIIIIGNVYRNNISFIVGSTVSLACLVNTFINFSIGVISDTFGINRAIFILPCSIFITFICFYTIRSLNKNIK